MIWSAVRAIFRTSWRRSWPITSLARPIPKSRRWSAPTAFATPRASRPVRRKCGATLRWPIAKIWAACWESLSKTCRNFNWPSNAATCRPSRSFSPKPNSGGSNGAPIRPPRPNEPMLPDLIEIAPLPAPISAQMTVPGSKSITNRALVLAALADGEITLRGALWSEDTQVMTAALQHLGFGIEVAADEREVCNCTIRIRGAGGKIPRGGTVEDPLELYVGNAGTAARFLAALICLGEGVYRLRGVSRMHERPQAALFRALRELGYRIASANDQLPADIFGTGPREGRCEVSIGESSQFASALLLCAAAGHWKVDLVGEASEEAAYVGMTRRLIEAFPRRGGEFQIEADASSASYFCAAGWLLKSNVGITSFPTSDWQIDAAFQRISR